MFPGASSTPAGWRVPSSSNRTRLVNHIVLQFGRSLCGDFAVHSIGRQRQGQHLDFPIEQRLQLYPRRMRPADRGGSRLNFSNARRMDGWRRFGMDVCVAVEREGRVSLLRLGRRELCQRPASDGPRHSWSRGSRLCGFWWQRRVPGQHCPCRRELSLVTSQLGGLRFPNEARPVQTQKRGSGGFAVKCDCPHLDLRLRVVVAAIGAAAANGGGWM
jgi:hypothetical protein